MNYFLQKWYYIKYEQKLYGQEDLTTRASLGYIQNSKRKQTKHKYL